MIGRYAFSIVIQADEESTNETLVLVMEAAKAAGVTNVSIAADN
jgi:biopolymer transport protein ExbD